MKNILHGIFMFAEQILHKSTIERKGEEDRQELLKYAPLYIMIRMANIDNNIHKNEKNYIQAAYSKIYPGESIDELMVKIKKQISNPIPLEKLYSSIEDEETKHLIYKLAYAVALEDGYFRNIETNFLKDLRANLNISEIDAEGLEKKVREHKESLSYF